MLRLLFVFSLIANLLLGYHVLGSRRAPSHTESTDGVVLVHFSSTIELEPFVMTEMACSPIYEDDDYDMFIPCNTGSASLFAYHDGERVALRDLSCRIKEVRTYGGTRYVPTTCDENIDPWTTLYDIEGLLYPDGTLDVEVITSAGNFTSPRR